MVLDLGYIVYIAPNRDTSPVSCPDMNPSEILTASPRNILTTLKLPACIDLRAGILSVNR